MDRERLAQLSAEVSQVWCACRHLRAFFQPRLLQLDECQRNMTRSAEEHATGIRRFAERAPVRAWPVYQRQSDSSRYVLICVVGHFPKSITRVVACSLEDSLAASRARVAELEVSLALMCARIWGLSLNIECSCWLLSRRSALQRAMRRQPPCTLKWRRCGQAVRRSSRLGRMR